MSDDELNDLFNEFLGGNSGPLPEPTPEEVRIEAMTATELHMTAFYEACETRTKGWREMLGSWLEELQHYLKVLEEYEEYEQCAKVFKCMREIREVSSNMELNDHLAELSIDVVHEAEPDSDEPDF